MIIASVIAIIMMAGQTVTNDIWYDEVFSAGFAKMSMRDLIIMTGRDVHPPFYYIYLKLFTSAGMAIFGKASYITLAKTASMLPWLLLFVLSLGIIRKKWGIFTAGLFLLFLTVMPQIGNYYVEIRMYSLALALITICGLSAYSIYEKRDGNKSYCWIILFLSGILTAYTQYYACIGIVGIYLGLFLALILDKETVKKKDKLIRLLICAGASVLLYIPWIPVVLRQFSNINGSYWIQPLTIRSIAGCIKFVYLPVCDKTIPAYLAVGLMLLSSVISVLFMIKKEKMNAFKLCLLFLMPLFIVILSGFVLSALGTPIFVYRYMVPVLGLFWLLLAISIDSLSDKCILSILLLIPFLLGGMLTCRGFYLEEHKKVTHMPLVEEAFLRLEEGAAIITNFDHVAAVSGYYLENDDIYLYEGEIDTILSDMMNGCGEYIDDAGILALLEDGRDVYFFGSFNSREDLLDKWKQDGIESYEEDSVLLERYWFNIYRLEKK